MMDPGRQGSSRNVEEETERQLESNERSIGTRLKGEVRSDSSKARGLNNSSETREDNPLLNLKLCASRLRSSNLGQLF